VCEADTLTNVDVTNEWSYTSRSPISHYGIEQDNFTFAFEKAGDLSFWGGGGGGGGRCVAQNKTEKN
jgi:hypothetical protein